MREWHTVLGHRPADEVDDLAARFRSLGLGPDDVLGVLSDGGDALYVAARSGDPSWVEAFGGALAAAMLAAEVSALSAHLNSRAAFTRGCAVEHLLDDYSAVAVATELGISRQKVYDIARAAQRDTNYLDYLPWSTK